METHDVLRGKKFPAALMTVLAFLFGITNAPTEAQETGANRLVLHHNGFEAGEEGLSRWWDNGDYTVNSAGLSEERSFKGKSSFKLDLTFRTGTSCYWKGTRFYIPLKGSPTIRCALYTERGNAQIGYGYNGGASGMCGGARQVRQHPSGWTEWEENTQPTAYDMDHLEWMAIYISGAPGERVVLYVDEFEVEGTPLPALSKRIEERIRTEADAEKKRSLEAFKSGLDEVRRQFEEARRLLSRARPPMPKATTSWLRKIDEQLGAYCESAFSPLKNELERLTTQGGGAWELTPIKDQLRYLRFALNSRQSLPGFTRAFGDRPYLVYVVPPIRNEKITPTCFPVPGVIGNAVSLSACPEEYSPASFAIYAAEELKDAKVAASALVSASSSRNGKPAPNADLFLVKCWWQAGRALSNCDPDNPVLTPELLLKDPGLVEVDNVTKRNKLKNPSAPRDAKTLQPVTIPAGTLQQYWVTVYIPKNTPAGVYKGTLKVSMQGAPGITLPLRVEVLPFQLGPPVLEYGIFYEGFLFDPIYSPDSPKPHFDSLMKTREQYLADMLDLKAHGLDLPACEDDILTNPDGALDLSHFRRIWELRKKAGLTKGPIVKTRPGVPISAYAYEKDPARMKELLKTIRDRTKQWMAFCKETGFPTPLIYGIDEAGGDVLGAERDAYKAVQEAGGMTAAAVGETFFRYAGDSLNRPIIHKGTTTEELKMIHDAGNKAWVYGNPQGGMEEPETYRRNYGLELWQRGYDGACTWAYQWPFGPSMWDDFDTNFQSRDHNMTYPAADGPISTIQWEGWREAYNDVRYLSTYLKLLESAKRKGTTRPLALEGERWLREVDLSGDLDLVRKEMVKRILQLRKVSSGN
ncbi:MAG: hypothetical protein HY318_09510 [Armatimonadetes bacterium]|nr:hypothetical protein [Armatimonadota bacterium]